MRFMMIVKASADSEAGKPPSPELFAALERYTTDLTKAGVLLDVAAGFWVIEVKSKEEAIEWAKRAPCDLAQQEIAPTETTV